MKTKYTKEKLEEIVKKSKNFADVLNYLNLRYAGGSHKIIKNHITNNNIDISHFETSQERIKRLRNNGTLCVETPIEDVLVENSNYSRGSLKRKLYKLGIKKRECEMCGQGEEWKGRKMSLIIDHINGIRNDNRIENLRIVCPNCNATLDTHCGKNKKQKKQLLNNEVKILKTTKNTKIIQATKPQKIKKLKIKSSNPNWRTDPKLKRRKIDRPPYSTLAEEVLNDGYLATGRKYGVSDNAIRKWIKMYEKFLNNQ